MAEYIIEIPFAWIYNETKGIKHESIVRCRDCKYYSDHNGERWCGKFDFLTLVDISNGFCAWGERK